MHPDLERLLDLQEKDLVLLDSDLRLKSLLDEVVALDAALARTRDDTQAARERVEEGVRKREELERISNFLTREYSGLSLVAIRDRLMALMGHQA